MSIPEEMLTAYVDGELSAEDRARVEAAMHEDPEVARRVEHHQSMRDGLRAAFDGVLREPVPERLLAAARGGGSERSSARAESTPSGMSDFAEAARKRDSRQAQIAQAKRRWSWPEWGAIAASLLIGVIVTLSLGSPDAPFTSRQGQLVAQGQLAEALSNQLASTQPPAANTKVGLSFRAKSGGYCRSFTMSEGEALAGLACREGDAWRIDVLARADAASGEYTQAGSALPAAVASAVEQRIDGEPLDAQSEARARQTGWQDGAAR